MFLLISNNKKFIYFLELGSVKGNSFVSFWLRKSGQAKQQVEFQPGKKISSFSL